MSDWEIAARQICLAQGSDPDALVDGKPAWLDWVAEAALLMRRQEPTLLFDGQCCAKHAEPG